ncbi:hypothetical protein L2K70_18755 [Nocardioides KLBMP 9356]|uniref:Uncharacterized protein n=1 Tax=Nocardioides potassii TaxID=2911371 RepID=A0ABS9HHQ5_9ACTN|nr:hypothetical protein [Nocardioides potassii]MCF6379656.1 hypothetical protein [Nocardioides potassii]
MSRITGVIVALATAAAVLSGSSVGAEPAAPAPPTAQLPRPIEGGVELAMADGDRLRVWATPDHRAVLSRRWDAATSTWGPRLDVVRRKNLSCGSVDARTANGAVAVIALCDRGGYYEDQAPTSSQALWSPDGVTWRSYPLEGEAYDEPGISLGGTRGVWPENEGYVTYGPEGFTRHRLATPNQEYTATATITDDAQVSYLYGTASGSGLCATVVLTRTGDATPSRQEVRSSFACSDVGFANVDANTVWLGDLWDRAQRTVISRPDASSPWAVTAIAPADAPGLEQGGRLEVDFFAAPGLPLLALGSEQGRRVRVQAYDEASQTWAPSTLAYDAGGSRCAWGDNWFATQLAVVAAELRCNGRRVVLTTSDGVTWQALRMGRHVKGVSDDGRYVAVPGRSGTAIISAERGVVTLPLPVTGRCDVVVPDGTDGAVLLTSAGRHRGWPTVLQHSSADGWVHLSRTDLPTFPRTCRRVRSNSYELPYGVDVFSGWKGYTVRIVQRDGEWTARRVRY